VQEARKASGLEITDRISLRWTGGADVASALGAHADEIADEVLAVSVTEDESAADHGDDDLDLRFSLAKA
jgi:isoleucyl-tRNA synthetase